MQLTGLPPIARHDARVLILGSMPGVASLAARHYYAHPANSFWRLLAEVLGEPLPQRAGERRALLYRHRIALWDVVHRCRRAGSLDAAIEPGSVEPNDIPGFLSRHQAIRHVFFNGTAAEQVYRRHIARAIADPMLCYARLPSSSPANASWSHARKLAAWRAVAVALANPSGGFKQ